VEIRGWIEVARPESGNGFTVLISPEPGLTGESEGAASQTGRRKVEQGVEAAGRELRSRGERKAPKGSGDPRIGRDRRAGLKKRDCSIDLARAGANRGERRNCNPNGLGEGLVRQRSSRPGTIIPEWWPGNGQSFRGSERPLRDVGSSRNITSGGLIGR
jgi:hypothetical protein